MEPRRQRSAALAAILSALLPGLGQFYNRQWGKGVGFFCGVSVGLLSFFFQAGSLLGTTDPDKLLQSTAAGAQPDNPGQLLFLIFLGLLGIGLALWSIADAAWVAKRQNSNT
jgi:hypothetical protein